MVLSNSNKPEWLQWLHSCPSTNTWAIANLANLQHGDVVFTPRQTAGRGQHGRIWHSPPGVLTASFILNQIPAAQLPEISLVAGLAVIYAVEDSLPDWRNVLRLKWPNDVLLDGRKLAGILCEGRVQGASGQVVVGVGLNRCADFAQVAVEKSAIAHAVSLHQVSSMVPDELLLLTRLRHYLLQTASVLRLEKTSTQENTGLSAFLPALHSRDALRDRHITLDLGTEKVDGQAMGIDDRGWLLLRLPDGELRAFRSGHVLYNDAR